MSKTSGPPKLFDGAFWILPSLVVGGPTLSYASNSDFELLFGTLGVTDIFSFQVSGETSNYVDAAKAVWVASASEGKSLNFYRFPIGDFDVPSPSEMNAILDALDCSVSRGHPVYMHCHGGRGRTGTVLGCWLVRHGLPATDVVRTVGLLRQKSGLHYDPLRPSSPETPDQKRMVELWSGFDHCTEAHPEWCERVMSYIKS